MRTIALVIVLAATACADSTAGVDASPLVDAPPPPLDADGRCPLVINEVAAAGQPDDWFELVNVSSATVELAGFRFIDEADDPSTAVTFTPGILAPGARAVQEVRDAVEGFQLGADDALWLYRVGESTHCDGVDWSAGDAPAGGSYSRVPDGTGSFETTEPDTRGVANR